MILKNKYTVGVLVMFYEIEMVEEYVTACLNALHTIKNTENITFHFCFNKSEHFETIDTDKISIIEIESRFKEQLKRLSNIGCKVDLDIKTNNDPIYNIAAYRRDLNYNYCEKGDFVLWGETDSLWPKETFSTIEMIDEYAKNNNINRYVLTFAYRKMWDAGWEPLEHVDMTNKPFIDTEEWALTAPESPKSYMTIKQMNEINSRAEELDIRILNVPKFDGSCLVISSDLIKSGANIPHALLCSGEDTSFADMAKLIMKDKYTQFVIKNILRVHNRRHPRKRYYIKDENNPRGFCGDAKGDWWKILEQISKTNLHKLINNQDKFYTFDDYKKELKKL